MKLVKRLTALFLAIVMTMAMGITAFADEAETPAADKVKITIESPVEGHTYKVYQLLTGSVSNLTQNEGDKGGSQGTLSDVKKGSSLNDTYAAEEKTADDVLNALRVDSTDSKSAFKTDAALGDAAYALIDTSKSVGTLGYVKGDGNTVTTVTEIQVDPGYYIIVDESYNGTDKTGIVYSRNMVTVVGNTKITPKTSSTDIDKNIIDTDSNKAFEATTDDDGNLTNKGGKTDTAAIGDVIQYRIDGKVPNTTGYKYYYYVVNDTFSEGLTLNTKLKEDDTTNTGIVVKIQKANKNEKGEITYDQAVTLTENTDYVVLTDDAAKPYTFRVAFKDMKGLQAEYNEGAIITVDYSATVNEKAAIGTDPNTNTANLTYSNKPDDSEQKERDEYVPGEDVPHGETVDKITKTYVTEIEIFKVDENGLSLTGAEFTLTGKNLNQVKITLAETFEQDDVNGTYYKLKALDPKGNATYTTEAPKANEYDEAGNLKTKSNWEYYTDATSTDEGKTVTCTTKYKKTTKATVETKDAKTSSVKATVGADGTVKFTGLNQGDYTLSETVTPTGYNTIKDIQFTISATQTGSTENVGGEITWDVQNKEGDSQVKQIMVEKDGKQVGTGKFAITIQNLPGSILPSTGGMGTAVIYVAGIAMIVAAGVVVIARKRFA